MNDSLIVKEVRSIQVPMLESAKPYFLESELDDLRCLIRLTVEFSHHIEDDNLSAFDLRYLCDSILSGVESFQSVSAAHRALPCETASPNRSDSIHIESLRREFGAKYREFLAEADFAVRCGLLLDLFKLQIVFVGASHA